MKSTLQWLPKVYFSPGRVTKVPNGRCTLVMVAGTVVITVIQGF
ncbi:MAG TPA: hypothetical protein VN176_17805 [Verrucomicrobiae bacterium]|nr:hypothetical protein [Verrucomicrobiae bacterium]